jgi:hypothetical protein
LICGEKEFPVSASAFFHVVRQLFNNSGDFPPPKRGKNPVVAFVMGAAFGPLGVGLYLESWFDFFVSLGLVVTGSVMTVGLGAPVFWVLCGAYAARRCRA